METIQHIIIDNTLSRIGEEQFTDYLCHAYCYGGYCTFDRNGQQFRFEAGDCLIIVRRGDLVMNLRESEDFLVDVIYVTQKFIEISTPQSNYGMCGQLSLFQNPIMRLDAEQQERCQKNFESVKRRLRQTGHLFRTSTDPHAYVIGVLCLRQSYKNKCEEQHKDDVSHPIVNLDNSFCFFFIHTSVSTRNMVMPSVDAAKV